MSTRLTIKCDSCQARNETVLVSNVQQVFGSRLETQTLLFSESTQRVHILFSRLWVANIFESRNHLQKDRLCARDILVSKQHFNLNSLFELLRIA